MEIRRRARRGVSPFKPGREVTMSGLDKGEKVVRREPEVGWGARCCVKVATKRLLEEQIAAVAVPGRGEKSDAMWHVPHSVLPGSFRGGAHGNLSPCGCGLFHVLQTTAVIRSILTEC